MKKVIVLTMMMVFLWTGVSFAENWIMYYDGGRMKSYFDADRVVKRGNGYDYWDRDEYTPEFFGRKYTVQHKQLELRNGVWCHRILESWDIDSQGAKRNYTSNTIDWSATSTGWSEKSYVIEFLNGLRKHAK